MRLIQARFCLVFVLAAGALMAETGGVRILRDVAFLEAGRAEKLDLYLPASPASGRPAVVIVHGGGFTVGDKADAREREIAGVYVGAGFVCASINYRLGDHSWNCNLFDCKNAVRFLRSHASEYRVDPNRIAVHGNSAGACLALLVGFTAGEAGFEPSAPYPGVSSAVAAVIDFYGRPDLLHATLPLPDGTPTDRPYLMPGLRTMLGCSPEENPALWRNASPLTHVVPSVPPVLIAQGLGDISNAYPGAIRLANTLRLYGVEHQLVLMEGVAHGFDLETWKGMPLPVDLRRIALDFLARSLPGPVAKS